MPHKLWKISAFSKRCGVQLGVLMLHLMHQKLMGVASTSLTGRGLTCRPIGMRSSASRSPSAVMHLRYRAFRHRCPFKQCRTSKQSAPDRCSVSLLFTWLRPWSRQETVRSASYLNHSVMNTSEDSDAFYRGKPCNDFSLFGGGSSDYSRLCMTSLNVIKRA